MREKNLLEPGKWYAEFDAQGQCTRIVCTPLFYKLLGYEKPEPDMNMWKVWEQKLHPEDREWVGQHFRSFLTQDSAEMEYDEEYRMMTKQGYHWFHGYVSCTRRENGTMIRCDGVVFDIQDTVDKEKVYQTLRQHNRFLGAIPLSADILTKSHIGLWAFELDEGKPPRMYVDDAMLGLIGLTHQITPEATYHAWYDYIDEGSYGLVTESVNKMIAGEHAEVQYPWHHPDGRTFIVRCGGIRNMNYTAGIRIEGVHQNVTEVLHFQEEKIAEQDVFNQYFLASYESAYYISLDTLKWQIYKRKKYLENKYPVYENYIESLQRYIETEVHPYDREQVRILVQVDKLKARLAKQPSFSFIFRNISKQSEPILQCEVLRGADENHIALGFKNVTAEERARREQEMMADLANQQRHIKAFGDMINAALWSMEIGDDDALISVYWSDEFRHQFGFESTKDFPNTIAAWADRLHPEDKEQTLEDLYRGLKERNTGAFVYDRQYRILRKTGEYCWYHAVGRMENIDDETRRMYGIITDISADKQLEEQQQQLETALAMAEKANQAKTEFLFNMSHDIRTPMNAITGFTEKAIRHKYEPDILEETLAKVKSSSEYLLRIINDILDMAKIESGKLELSETLYYAGGRTHSLIEVLGTEAARKGLEFHTAYQITDPYIWLDENRTSQILVNLISNAIKYTKPGGEIWYSMMQIPCARAGYGRFVATVEDTGCGMSAEFLTHIFNAFERSKSAIAGGEQGTGLGMSIVKKLSDAMGGTIDIQSELGKGTKISFTVEYRLATPEEIAVFLQNEQENDRVKAASFDLSGRRVLVVEDNDLNREIAYDILSEADMEIEMATDGAMAVELLKKKGSAYYEVILMDIQMPVMNGYEATKAIRAMYPEVHIPIIALSANAFTEDKTASLAAGMDGHVAKPINIQELFAVLARLL